MCAPSIRFGLYAYIQKVHTHTHISLDLSIQGDDTATHAATDAGRRAGEYGQ